jgi:hypothetical protein
MRNSENVKTIIAQALRALNTLMDDQELIVPKSQLLRFADCLEQMKNSIERGDIPPLKDRPDFMGRAIVDSWPLNLPAATLVIKAERSFLDL